MAIAHWSAPHLEFRRQHQIGGFRRAAGEGDVGSLRANKCRNLAAGALNGGAGGTPFPVDGRRIAGKIERRHKDIAHDGQKRRRGVPVHICPRQNRHDDEASSNLQCAKTHFS
jgi:hypothetical protein